MLYVGGFTVAFLAPDVLISHQLTPNDHLLLLLTGVRQWPSCWHCHDTGIL
jgi:hypothetical protein